MRRLQLKLQAAQIRNARPGVRRIFVRTPGANSGLTGLAGVLNSYQGGIYICGALRIGFGIPEEYFP